MAIDYDVSFGALAASHEAKSVGSPHQFSIIAWSSMGLLHN
jgi:hypothetical protein